MYGRLIAHDLAKRDAERVLCERFREWIGRHILSADPNDNDQAYRKGWNAAMKLMIQHLASR